MFEVRVTYNEPMNTNRNPVVTFSPAVATTLTYDPAWSWWASNTTFLARFDVSDAGVEVPHVGIGVSGGQDVAGNVQSPYSGTDDFGINTLTTPLTVLSAVPNRTSVTDNNVGTPQTPPTNAGFAVTVTYSGAMNTSSTPAVTFSPDASTTLISDPALSRWTSTTVFVAAFDVADAGVNIAGVHIRVAGALDAAGHAQARYLGPEVLSIDTLDPAPALAQVASAAPSVATITDANLGTAAFSVRITYGRPMRGNSNPAFTFSPDVSSTLTYNAAQSWWINSTTFQARFDVADANVAASGVGIGVTGAMDLAGNFQAPYAGTNQFNVDTLSPPPAPANVVSVSPNVATVTDTNVGTATFSLRIAFDEPMNINTRPAITFTPAVASTLTFDAAQSWWVSNTAFSARFDVRDANVAVANIGVGVASAYDAAGNVQAPYNGSHNFSIDTLHTPASPAIVLRAVPSLTTITGNNAGTATFTVRIEYNAAMNINTRPVVSFTRDVTGSLYSDPAWSWWVSNRAFLARYDVADIDAEVLNIGMGVTGAYDAAGNLQAPYSARRSACCTTSTSTRSARRPPRRPSPARRRT